MLKVVYLIVRADQTVRLTKGRIRLAADEVAIPIRINFPDSWGKTLSGIEIDLPDELPAVNVQEALVAEDHS
jgi:hypothetical protein